MIKEYLTEELLKNFLRERSKLEFIHNKQILINGIRFRPDFRSTDNTVIIEFDGHHHYHVPERILRDSMMKSYCGDNGIKLIRIPYFIQLNSQKIIKHIFGDLVKDNSPFNDYPHGFIDEKAMLPNEFSTIGSTRYALELSNLPSSISEEIEESAIQKMSILRERFKYK